VRLTAGTKLGSHEILAPLGAGGMGEVYRARDTKLNRDVAIKVLLPSVANDPDRLARFSREAQVLASLNHPNIAHIYGVEEANGVTALVMELVDGEDLSRRIARGPIPIDEAVPIARQIAEALEAAHEHGIVHRDLKPANIKVRDDGTVKVLDFGLAKAMDPAGGSSVSMMNSPTLSFYATEAGVILGTAAYMSPEQAAGKSVDKRSDLWAFGVVLLEMLTGRQAFAGETVSHVLAAVLKDEPDWTALPSDTPATIRRLLRRCLVKERRRRLADAADARLEIDEALTAPANEASGTARPQRAGAMRFMPAVAGAVLLLIAAAAGWLARPGAPATGDLVTFTVETGSSRRPDGFALSPDGRQLAFVAEEDGRERLWLRSLASADAKALPGTEGASSPFWSPDSRSIAFFAGSELKRLDIADNASRTICRAVGNAAGGTWNDQQVILFSNANAGGANAGGILRVPAGGGEPQLLTTLQPGMASHQWPVFMPDGRHFIYLASTGGAEGSQLMWRALDTPEEHLVRPLYSKAFYSPTGHLLFRNGGPIVAQRFDAGKGTLSGEPIQVSLTPDAIQRGIQTAIALSLTGVVAYRAGSDQVAQLSWVDRSGKTVSTVGAVSNYSNPFLDPSSDRVVANTLEPYDVWLLDGRRGTTSRLTFDAATDSDPIFSADGRWVAFYSRREPPGIYRKASSGAGADELLTATGLSTFPRDWSSDGRFLLYDHGPSGAMWALPTAGGDKPFRYPPSPPRGAQLTSGHFSWNAKWVAYVSDETVRPEIFVQDFPSGAAKFQVSVAGGTEPRWRRDGRELFFIGGDGQLMAVDVETAPSFRLGVPKPLFQTRSNVLPLPSRRYGVSADGTRFMMNVPLGNQAATPLTVILNWPAALKNP